MAQIDVNTLLMAIQAIEAQSAVLTGKLELMALAGRLELDEAADTEDMLLGYSKAAETLRLGYEAEARKTGHLPAYEALLRGAVSQPVYPGLRPQTMVVVIQSLQADIRKLRDGIMDDDATPDECQLFEDFMAAAEDLERVYKVMTKTITNFPPYEELV